MDLYIPKFPQRMLRLREEGRISFGTTYFGMPKSVEVALRRISWTDEDVIMDIGCGNGYRTAYLISLIIKHYKRILAIDKRPNLINHARIFSRARNLEYFVSDIEDVTTFLEEWQRGMTKIISIDCFHEVEDQKKAFQYVFELMPPGGEALLYFKIPHPIPSSIKDLVVRPEVPKALKGVFAKIFDFIMYGSLEMLYRDKLRRIGFQILLYQEELPKKPTSSNDGGLAIATCSTAEEPMTRSDEDPTILTCETEEEYRALWKTTWQLPLFPLSLAIKNQLLEKIFQIVMKYQEKNSYGQTLLKYKMLLLHLRVPKPY